MAAAQAIIDERYMAAALALAVRTLGVTSPNPAVGAIIVRDGLVVGRGWTMPGGRPHAEAVALAQAGALARGATCYVSLEPCSHHGKTPPCAEALVAAGVGRVVVGCGDPDPRVAGGGLNTIQRAGIDLSVGVLEEQARTVAAGFLSRIEHGRPLVTLKLATTADGRSATANGHSRWITGPVARAHAHAERARHDAIMVGADTVIADDPALTCRLPGLAARSPLRIAIDRRGRIPATARLRVDNAAPTLIIRSVAASADGGERARDVLTMVGLDGGDGDLDRILRMLAARGITRLLVESGGRLAAALIRRHLVDHVDWYRAPSLLGGDAVPAIGALALSDASDAVGLTPIEHRVLDPDSLDRFEIRH
ncbi:bifunctional diaminohydroxyphosphoribosylaminopyrimidine deaminase/5-amino-6-(5-phosphoribosylamino)uracil reductase RibD [Fodinicurvata sp. EGI_FJ10296]|uniref:bifunctional diaminohydroxyphosphoribosylaminopyrimidine deaminase/5-amino-6-(5-phosphoribosylamino)uracil reductase RibD n=1 Tax=Fodinicurvata sp. EGI_FJ10296 TaxID=3231908 RepID=UPI003456E090